MKLTDSHCHLAMLPPGRADEVLARARSEGVAGVVVPGTAAADSIAAVILAGSRTNVWPAVGFHPHEAKDCDADAFASIRQLASGEEVVAIGEIGLDYHYMYSPRDVQRSVFMQHMALARELNLPALIHNRESSEDLLDLLRSEEVAGVRGVLHSFTESYEIARVLLDLGFMISFSGILTFRSAEPLRDVATKIPKDRVLIETDTPYLAPVPHRGKENEPAFVGRIAAQLAALWGSTVESVAEQTTLNFEQFFGVEIADE
ncbi:MAG: TatD family hydrolase [Acidobacteriota bacterium]